MKKYFLILFVCMSTNLYGQNLFPTNNLRLDVDYSRYYGADTLTYLEVYYSFRTNHITYQLVSGKYVGGINIFMHLMAGDSILQAQEWTAPSVIIDTTEFALGKTLVGLRSFFLKPGEYSLKIKAIDFNAQHRIDSMLFPLKISSIPNDIDALSDIELCTSIKQIDNDEGNVFYKNTLEVIPNVNLVYGAGLPILSYYIEAYNLIGADRSDNYKIITTVVDAGGKEIISREKQKSRINPTSVEVGTINTMSLKGGTYILKISLVDDLTKKSTVSSKKFFVYKPDDLHAIGEISEGGFMSTPFAVMNEDDIQNEYEAIRYIASDDEKKQYDKLSDLEARRKYLFDFWLKRDIDRTTEKNEFRNLFMERYDYSNTTYSTSFTRGWKSDRGRVHILYGKADDIERFPNSLDMEPYEIWYYNTLQGGVIFVFGDRSGYGDFRLLHSTHRDELQDDNWMNRIKRTR